MADRIQSRLCRATSVTTGRQCQRYSIRGEKFCLLHMPRDEAKKKGYGTPSVFVKGKSGNPAGRPPKRIEITTQIRKALEVVRDGKQVKEILADMMIERALEGDFKFCKEILDRTEGPVRVELSGPDGEALEAPKTVNLMVRIEDYEVLLQRLAKQNAVSGHLAEDNSGEPVDITCPDGETG